MEIFKIDDEDDHYLIIDGSRVINGEYDVARVDSSKIELKDIYTATYVCNVPTKIKGDYRDILEWFYKNKEEK